MSSAEVASSSRPDWLNTLRDLGFSEEEAEDALVDCDKKGQETTVEALVNAVLDRRQPSSEFGVGRDSGLCIEYEDKSNDGKEEEDEEQEGEGEGQGEEEDMALQRHDRGEVNDRVMVKACSQPDYRWRQLRGMGYERDLVSLALSNSGESATVADLVDWLSAYTVSDLLPTKMAEEEQEQVDPEPQPEPEDGEAPGVIEGLKKILPYELSTDYQEQILKHGCKDVAEALDLIDALQYQEKLDAAERPGTSHTSGTLPLLGMPCSKNGMEDPSEFWDCEDVDAYDLGCTSPPGESEEEELTICVTKRRKTEKRGRSTVLTSEKEEKVKVNSKDGKTGFGVPGRGFIPRQIAEKSLAQAPYFYFENVASMPKDQWAEITRHLYSIQPEFVDSLHFSACRRPRGYIHNLPVEGRQLLIPPPPMTVQELFPETWGRHWPEWDLRQKLNCIDTKTACHSMVQRMSPVINSERLSVDKGMQVEVVRFSKKWNLVWTGPNQLSPLACEEMEISMGYDAGHTRGVVNRVDRCKAIGNSFQVNTVAYHLSVLKPLYPAGMKVISIFAGIGGAEVALHKIGIKLNVLVSVEKEDKVRQVVRNWWDVTEQQGILVHDIKDVKDLTRVKMVALRDKYGKFDLLIGGSPCNNLSGNNRYTRTGLQGPDSYLFHDYKRILYDFRELMRN